MKQFTMIMQNGLVSQSAMGMLLGIVVAMAGFVFMTEPGNDTGAQRDLVNKY
ncbi:MAG: hypothetical protein AB7V04_00200 [Desulfomonilaceae bacterium]